MRNTGWPPPRLLRAPLPVAGSIAAITSAMELAPNAAMSCSLNSAIGFSSTNSCPRIRVPSTTMVFEAEGGTAVSSMSGCGWARGSCSSAMAGTPLSERASARAGSEVRARSVIKGLSSMQSKPTPLRHLPEEGGRASGHPVSVCRRSAMPGSMPKASLLSRLTLWARDTTRRTASAKDSNGQGRTSRNARQGGRTAA